MLPSSLTIATRKSRLALWQAEHVQARLRETHPGLQVELLPMSTLGDEVLDRSLNEIGGKGLFTKELELALLDGRADLAVHSLKDVPMELGADFALACVMRREDPRDAFVSARYASLEALPDGARVGTSSLRRGAQIRARHPRLQVLPLRGNLDTRLGKLDRGEYDAIVLAAAGLKRLGLAERIRGLLPSADSLPAVGQGALGIETLASRGDVREALAPLADAETWLHVRAERAVSRVLGGSCRVPLAAHCTSRPDGGLRLVARVARPDGTDLLEASAEAPGSDEAAADAIAAQVCADLLGRGAAAILAAATA